MSRFLYFLPDTAENAKAICDAINDRPPLMRALADVARTEQLVESHLGRARVGSNGPEGHGGVVITPIVGEKKSARLDIGYYADRQTWKASDGESYWIGWPNDAPVMPHDLLRRTKVPGHPVLLGDNDGQEWIVPVIRRGGRYPAVPQITSRVNGKMVYEIRRDWLPAWEMSAKVWELCFSSDGTDWETAYDYCRMALGINYRVDDLELSILQSLDTENFLRVFRALVDWPVVMEILGMQLDGDELVPKNPELLAET